MHPTTPEESNVLLTIRTPSHDHDWRQPDRWPHEILEWSVHRAMPDALRYLTELADPCGPVGQRVEIESLAADDPRRFVDWSAQSAASRAVHGY